MAKNSVLSLILAPCGLGHQVANVLQLSALEIDSIFSNQVHSMSLNLNKKLMSNMALVELMV